MGQQSWFYCALCLLNMNLLVVILCLLPAAILAQNDTLPTAISDQNDTLASDMANDGYSCGREGDRCYDDYECCDRNCRNGRCERGSGSCGREGDRCYDDYECCDRNCRNGRCERGG